MDLNDKDQGLKNADWTGHRTQALRLAITEEQTSVEDASCDFPEGEDWGPSTSSGPILRPESKEGALDSGVSPASLEGKAAALKEKRKRERLRKKAAADTTGPGAARRVDFIRRSLQVAQEDFGVEDAVHSNQGYEGTRDGGLDWRGTDPGLSRLDFLRASRGYLVIDATGQKDVDIPFVDGDGRIWAVILAEPAGWDIRRKGIQAARDRLDRRTAHLTVRPNRRGNFQSFNYGFSFGNGRTEPMNFVNDGTLNEALTEFYQDEHVQALFKYAESAIQTWFPDHRSDFQDAIMSCQALHPGLQTPVPGSSFAASTVNVGPRVDCLSHRDSSNEASGICLDYIDGEYNSLTGGHLVFHEAMRVVRMRHGGIAIFPSAIVTHETIPIKPHETRFSITGYIAGGIKRYLDAGGRTLAGWREVDPEAAARSAKGGEERWESGCQRFKTVAELISFWLSRA